MSSDLAERVVKGDVRAAARLMRLIDDAQPSAEAELRAIFSHTGKAWLIGITGNPGAIPGRLWSAAGSQASRRKSLRCPVSDTR